jgi:hypothetical protein
MPAVTPEYVETLPDIYKDVLNAFWMFNPQARPDWGIAPESIHVMLRDKYTRGEIRGAFQQMVEGGALVTSDQIFYRPTAVGQEIIESLQGAAEHPAVPAFPSPPAP